MGYCCRIFTPVQPDYPAASLRDFLSGAHTLPNAGQNVANFSVASTERFTDRSGTRQERTEWFRVVAFGKLADRCGQFLSKGRRVYIEGRLSTREYWSAPRKAARE